MREPEEILRELERRWSNRWTEWLDGGGGWPLSFGLKPPVERVALGRWSFFSAWRDRWLANPMGGEVIGQERAWSTMGRQFVPERLQFANAEDVAATLGKRGYFDRANGRYRTRLLAWPDLGAPLRAIASWMADLDEVDYERFVLVVDWLSENPGSGLYLRQLPIAGIDTKWIERNKRPLVQLLSIRFGAPTAASLVEIAGLKSPPVRVRVRLLDPALRSWCMGLSDIELPLDELRSLNLPARLALVVENNVTALACTDLPGAILIMGGGFSVTRLGTIPWLDRIPILYWGDIDTWGFSILAALRHYHPKTVSCLMDEATLEAHLWLRSSEDQPSTSIADGLTSTEAALFDKLLTGKPWGMGLRIEQERLDWGTAWPIIVAMAASMTEAKARTNDG
ncbi:Wadjet anti-phage system protein JetD domain-containing protein [Dyella sp. 20L07]|uniref:Wadjet anti-phage system protein JetD domain-containing protein n=1 Tax=Dyella sp. 20L07 TaxID=3384240 RepID=UPI003D2BAA27